MATALKQPRPTPPPAKSRAKARRQAHQSKLAATQAQQPLAQPSRQPPLAVVSAPGMAPGNTAVSRLPRKPSYPFWLTLLLQCQRGSWLLTLVLVTAALVVYSSTIYMQQYWSKGYRNLKSMQQSERQMTVMGEALKNQIMQQAEKPGAGLVPRAPTHTIQMEPASPRPPAATAPLVIRSASSTDAEPVSY